MENKPLFVRFHHGMSKSELHCRFHEGAWCSNELSHQDPYLLISGDLLHRGETSLIIMIVVGLAPMRWAIMITQRPFDQKYQLGLGHLNDQIDYPIRSLTLCRCSQISWSLKFSTKRQRSGQKSINDLQFSLQLKDGLWTI